MRRFWLLAFAVGALTGGLHYVACAEDLLGPLRTEVEAEVSAAAHVDVKTTTVQGRGEAMHQTARETIVSLATGEATYRLQYDCAVDEQGQRLPFGGPLSELGMPAPAEANWYDGGFIDVLLDGQGLARVPATITPLPQPPGSAAVRVTWPHPAGTVTLTFHVYAFDPVLYATLELPAAAQRQVKLLCYPNSFGLPRDRWLTTPRRDIQHRDNLRETLAAAERDWVLYSDRAADMVQAPTTGPCALVLLPDQWSSAVLAMGEPERPDWPAVQNYGIITTLASQAGQTRLGLALVDFLPMNWTAARVTLQRDTQAIQGKLKTLVSGTPLQQ